MSKRLILILVLAFVVGIAFAAYAEVQNVKVSGDLNMKGITRQSLTLKDNEAVSGYGEAITAILSQARVRVDADLTDNVSTTVRLLNERAWGEENDTATAGTEGDDTDIDLNLAYVTLKEFLYSPLTLTVGRQELRFGNALIIGDPDTDILAGGALPNAFDDLSLRKAFDAIKATLNYDPLVVDLIYSKIDENAVEVANDTDLYGLNAGYALNKDTYLETYYFQKINDPPITTAGTGYSAEDKEDKTGVVGARGVYSGIQNLTLALEGAYQFGNKITNHTAFLDDNENAPRGRKRNAYAIQAFANYALPKVKYTPVLGIGYTYLSGDKYLSISDNYTGWDPMYEDQQGGLANAISAASNTQAFNVNASIKPMEDVSLALDYSYIMLVYPYTNAASGVTLLGAAGYPTYRMKADKKEFGSDVNLSLTYDYTEDVQLGLKGGAFIPGHAFDNQNDKTATQVIGSMKVTF